MRFFLSQKNIYLKETKTTFLIVFCNFIIPQKIYLKKEKQVINKIFNCSFDFLQLITLTVFFFELVCVLGVIGCCCCRFNARFILSWEIVAKRK